MRKRRKKTSPFLVATLMLMCFFGYYYQDDIKEFIDDDKIVSYTLDDVPSYSGKDYVYINNNVPNFDLDDISSGSFQFYSNLDFLGRCGYAYANIDKDLMPTEKRGNIGMVKPSGWHTIKYDNIEGKYLYNRCHLIGYQLTGQNANVKNLITCTRHMNSVSMLEFENRVASYIRESNNHVLYRVTPVYDGDNLVASGVVMEAYSIEDSGKGIKFNVYVYNVQDGIEIDYKTGDSKRIK